MSLKPTPIEPVPEQTARIARAAFPKGNSYLTLRDEFGTLYRDEDFAGLFSVRGQPALPPWRLALVTILQFHENLSDRQAAQAVRARIDWKYLLGLELAPRQLSLHPQAHHEALSAARQRLGSEEGWTLYARRAGIEGTLSQAVRAFGLRRTRYRGLAKTSLQHVATAVAMNVERVTAWLTGQPREKTRTSRFARLAT
ncbi:IS1182 family transposase [Polaromonas glacialis]|uniref:IS1182 family transposase n=1 Tax=Polaromonas glacialis TaxID=866564 RepID=UPI000495560E|nr:IS1182 family transposase [Polaromonas glacialis]